MDHIFDIMNTEISNGIIEDDRFGQYIQDFIPDSYQEKNQKQQLPKAT